MGCQFLISDRSFLAFGKHVIIHCRSDTDKCPFENPQFIAFIIKCFNCRQNTLTNSTVMPSIPGDLFDFIFFKTCPTSSTVNGVPMSRFGIFAFDSIPKLSKFILCRLSSLFSKRMQ